MGGRANFEQRLDALFTEQYDGSKYAFLGQFPDATGLIGQYCQGNEPAFHIPYLYNYAGAPWKTQRKVREIMKLWFAPTPLGICGDEDNGAMSSWYVFSAIGLYPVCPGKPVYDMGSPLFEETRLRLADGRTFTIRANRVSERNKYIQSARLNGREWNVPRIPHAEVAAGGQLVLEMGDRPNKAWGQAASR
jgi:predicted alpha-1,2-mannosidase